MRSVEPAQFIPAHKPTRVSVWTKTNELTVVSYPHIDGDTLRGVVLDDPWAMPLKDVARVEAKAPNRARTLLFVAGATASAVGVYLLTESGHGPGAVPCEPDFTPAMKALLCTAP